MTTTNDPQQQPAGKRELTYDKERPEGQRWKLQPDSVQQQPDAGEIAMMRATIKAQKEVIAALNNLVAAYRTGNQGLGARAADQLTAARRALP